MKHFVVVSKGEVSTMYLAFQDAEIQLEARRVIQRLQVGGFIPSDTQIFGPSSKTRVITQQGEWFAFLLTLPPGEEETIAKIVTHRLEKLLNISLVRLSDRKLEAAAAYTTAIMKHR